MIVSSRLRSNDEHTKGRNRKVAAFSYKSSILRSFHFQFVATLVDDRPIEIIGICGM